MKTNPGFCPKCYREYDDSRDKCSACDIELVDKLPWLDPAEVSKWAVLRKNIGDMEADQLISVLSFYGIPAKKYYRGSSQYVSIFMGATSIGVYLIVREGDMERAEEILAAESEIPDDEEDFDWDEAGDIWDIKE